MRRPETLLFLFILTTSVLFSVLASAPSSSNNSNNNMGQAMRMVKYDRAANEANAKTAIHFLNTPLSWFRLDDGVMGGQSETTTDTLLGDDKDGNGSYVNFQGTINTNGGGFCSIRSRLEQGPSEGETETVGLLPPNTHAIRLRLQGDGKTYKLTLSEGIRSAFGGASWQTDIPTTTTPQDVTIELSKLKPSFGGGPQRQKQTVKPFRAEDMKEIGLMLSLKLSDGSDNPKETFGQGIFPFQLKVWDMEPILKDSNNAETNE